MNTRCVATTPKLKSQIDVRKVEDRPLLAVDPPVVCQARRAISDQRLESKATGARESIPKPTITHSQDGGLYTGTPPRVNRFRHVLFPNTYELNASDARYQCKPTVVRSLSLAVSVSSPLKDRGSRTGRRKARHRQHHVGRPLPLPPPLQI